MKDDRLISLNAAIDALDKVAEMFPYRIPGNAKTYRQYNEAWSDAIDAAENALEALPSAQPSATDTNIATTDTISRAVAIEKVKKLCEGCYLSEHCGKCLAKCLVRKAVKILEKVSPAQPGWTYIEEALPKTIINEHTHDFQEYNCLCDFGDNGFDVRTYKFGNGHFWNGGGIVDKYVTAWQPLPEIPDALKQKSWEGGQDES